MAGSGGSDPSAASDVPPHPRLDRNVTCNKYRDSYYTAVYISKEISEALDFLAKVNGQSKKQALDQMLRLGIGHYFGELVAQQNRLTGEQRERGEPQRPTYFTACCVAGRSKKVTISANLFNKSRS